MRGVLSPKPFSSFPCPPSVYDDISQPRFGLFHSSEILALGIILFMHLYIPRANRLGAFGARKSLGIKKQVSGNQSSLRAGGRRTVSYYFTLTFAELCSLTLQEYSNSGTSFGQGVEELTFQSISAIN